MTISIRPIFLLLPLCVLFLTCGGKKESGLKEEKSSEELIRERFAIYKDGYNSKDINRIMSVIASTYWDSYNDSKEAYRSWLQNAWAGWEWKERVEMNITSNIEIQPGMQWARGYQNPKGDHEEETQIWAVNNSQNLLMSSKSSLHFSWESIQNAWYITRITGMVARVTTQPSSVSKGAEVSVAVFSLPEGAPVTAYDTKSATINDWNGSPIPLQNQGNGRYSGTFTAPSIAGDYTLTASVADTTFNKTISLPHTFTVK